MFCTKCGAMIDGAGKFCPKCGAPIAGEEKKQQQTVNEMEQGNRNRISQTLRKKFIVGFIGAAAIILMIIVVTARDTVRSGKSDFELEMYEITGIGGAIRPIEFDVVGINQQPDYLKDIIEEKYADSFQISYTLGEDLYIAIGYGKQPSDGYSISVNAFYETENALVISTTLIEPTQAENVTNTPTNPYIVVKIKNIEDKVIMFK